MKSIRDGSNLILLPKQLWCSLKDSGGETCTEVGWLYDEGYAITSRCCFSSEGKLKVSFIYDLYICVWVIILYTANGKKKKKIQTGGEYCHMFLEK